MENKKNDSANIDKQRMAIMLVGLCLSMAFVVAAFEYYSVGTGPVSMKGKMADALEEEKIEQIVLSTPPPPPPPPPPAAIENVTVVDDDDIEETDLNLDKESDNTEEVFFEEEKAPEVEQIFEFVGQQAEYPGGMKELYAWLGKEIQYPAIARENGIQGKVFVKFVVEKDGKIGDTQVLNAGQTHPSLEKEALRVIKSMKKWKAAENNGKVVRSYFTIPVNFALK